MSKQPTLAQYSAATDSRLDGIERGIQRLLEARGVTTAPKQRGKKSTKSTKSTDKKETTVSTTKDSKKVKTLTRKTRAAFVKKHDWATGLGVAAISALLLSGEQEAAGWKVATFREAKAAGVTTSEFVAARGVTSNTKASTKAKTRRAQKQDLSLLTYAQLYAEAQKANVKGRSNMNSAQLVSALS